VQQHGKNQREERSMDTHGTYIRAYALNGLADLVRKHGGTPEDLFREVGLPDPALVDMDMLISYRRFANLLELCARTLRRPSFGLEWAAAGTPNYRKLGPLSLMQFITSDFREWLEMGKNSLACHTNAFRLQEIDAGRPGEVTYRQITDSFILSSRQQTEHTFGLICQLARKAVNEPEKNPSLVRFSHSRPRDISVHERIFRCPLEFDTDYDELVFPNHFLDLKTNGSIRLLQPLVTWFIRHRMDRLTSYDQSVTTTVMLAIPSIIGTGNCNIEFVSDALGVTVKHLQRALAAEATSFSILLEQVRKNMAIRFLTESNIPVERVARLLDYSSTPPFSSAFKRWTGIPPLQYRKLNSGYSESTFEFS
jgi:AraC-like DNA-binding protein